jgi:hypothetical protein
MEKTIVLIRASELEEQKVYGIEVCNVLIPQAQ